MLFLGVRQAFLFLPVSLISVGTGLVILYFSHRFLSGFKRYYFGKKSFRAKMEKLEGEVIQGDAEKYGEDRPSVIPLSLLNSLPVFSITLTEGFEASLVLAAAGAFNLEWTVIGALASIALLVVVSAVSYEYLLRVPRWGLDLVAGLVLLSFGAYFLITGAVELFLPP